VRDIRMAMSLLLSVLPIYQSTGQQPRPPAQWVAQISPFGDKDAEALQFSHPSGIAIDRQGRVYVADRAEHQVRVFDDAGRWLKTVGRLGQGPGDLSQPTSLGVDGTGRLWVFEAGNRRWSVFRWAGDRLELGQTLLSPERASEFGMTSVVWDTSGAPILYSIQSTPDPTMLIPVRRVVRANGSFSKTTLVPSPGPKMQRMMLTRAEANGQRTSSTSVSQPYGPSTLVAFGPAGAWATANSGTYTILLYRGDSTSPTIIRSSVPPVRVTPFEARRSEAYLDTLSQEYGQRIPFEVPKTKPPLYALGFDWDGRLWVRLEQSIDSSTRSADVYDPGGKLVARATWPKQLNLESHWAITEYGGYGVQVDENGVRTLVRVRWVPSP